MKQKLLSLFFVLTCLIGVSMAQNRQVSGKVTSATDGAPLSGVSVSVVGTSTATQTDGSGNYSISVNQGAALNFSFIGYNAQRVTVGSQSSINIQLVSEDNALEEVVVTALGVKKEKKAVGYSVQEVKSEDILSSREPNVINALAGKVAGLQISSSGGQAGSSAMIQLRGNTSITGSGEPLFVIDGIPVDNGNSQGDETVDPLFTGTGSSRLADLDPNIIESVSVLKGAGASALYGSRGMFGVIMITTKKGASEESRKIPRISVSSSVSLDNAITAGFQNTYLQGLNGLYRNGLPLAYGGYAEQAGAAPQTSAVWGPHKDSVSQAVINAIGMPKVLDPRKQFYQTGVNWNNSVSMSGGGGNTSYILTYSNTNQEGIVPNNTFKRNSFTGGFTTKLSELVTSSTSVTYSNTKNNRMIEGNGGQSFLFGLNFAPASFDMKEAYEKYGNLSWQSDVTATGGFNNPFWIVNNNSRPSNVNRFVVSNETTVDLLPWLKLINRAGLDTYSDLSEEKVDVGTKGIPNGRYFSGLINYKQWNNDLILSANYEINDDWSISGLIGTNYNQQSFNRRTIRGVGLDIPGFFDISGMTSQQAYQKDWMKRLVGIYASANIDYKNYLYLNLTARNDWSSTLPTGNNSFFYPSASASFIFTEAFDLANDVFSFGKVRASVAQAGNDAPPYYTTQAYVQATPGDGTRGEITFPYNGVNGFKSSSVLASIDLKPEIVTEYEVGTELRFFRNRIGLEFSYYNKKSENQILQQPMAPTSGYAYLVANAGKLSNSGVEVMLDLVPVKTNDFTWNIVTNFSKNKYKLESLAEGVDNIYLGGFDNPQVRIDANYGYVIWGKGFQKNEKGETLIDDEGLPLESDLGPIGNVLPDWNMGIRNSIRYKNLALSGLLDVRTGGKLLNLDLTYTTYYGSSVLTEDRGSTIKHEGVREDGSENDIVVTKDQNYYQNWFSNIDQNFIEDAGYIKLREVTLSYTLPKTWLQKAKIGEVTFSATGRNLWIKSDFSYKDPEGSLIGNQVQGLYHSVTPGSKGFTFGVNVKF
ncbi:SusC/RagA family TonB-linked outer membrane protein [Sphingobacterium faecale]|uniref:SusC/RagA family TonB-linked outer membrane protein n=1 Tax=Sphingobacterium faecale TaxID=2803775 RepID=A0ABS1R7M7_9SPHI|nr:SusC/RagA family TonB-linked outer membrane protein [Sphingobacterium faecale]MBL1410716.1 SusC/RagA family TonB-linked outer membrane protein [Sphingobacterium faecale]